MPINLFSPVLRNPSTQMRAEVIAGIGRCIYCTQPSEKLTLEHIIPESLNGTLLFRDAVCMDCKSKTGDTYEQQALNGPLLIPRVLLELKRKDLKRKSVKKLPPIAHRRLGEAAADEEYDQHYDATQIARYPKIFPLAMTGLPGLLSGKDLSAGAESMVLLIVNLQIQTGYEPKEFSFLNELSTGCMEMFAAKIGYSYAVAMRRSVDEIDMTDLRSLVMGERQDVFNFVGANTERKERISSNLHELSMLQIRGYWVAKVHLFASCMRTPYLVVLGKCR